MSSGKAGRVGEKVKEKKDSGVVDASIVAAIDFGTTYSGYAFSFKDDYDKDPLKICSFAWDYHRCLIKTSTCVLFDPDQNFANFGYDAETQYGELAAEGTDAYKDWFYFRRFKMQLSDNKEVKKPFMIRDETGKTMEARKVFGAGIKYLKEHFLLHIKRNLPETQEEDIRFVLTVPAIWNEGAKLFMREAATEAGIIPDRLLIALEPEAAFIYCKHQLEKSNIKPFATGSRYVILDAGGVTIDITVHEVQSDGHVKELYNANGGELGGAFVDKCFEDFLRKVIGDDVIDQIKKGHAGEYHDIFREFEVKKREMKNEMRDKVLIKLGASIPVIYKSKRNDDLQKSIKADPTYGVTGMVGWIADRMKVKKEICFTFFEGALQGIGDHLEELMKKPECNGADTILMVGGFSESPLLQEYIRKRFPKKRVIVPEGPGMSVLKGAVIFGHDPTATSERKCRLQVLAEKIEREETRPPVQTTTETAKPTPTKTGRVDEKVEEKKDSGLLDAFIVAAIDFGTTYSGYAFSFKHDYDKDPTQISTFAWPGARCLMSLKTSTCILFDPDQNFASFGYEAEDQYSELAGDGDDEHKDWYYFRRFKMQLFDNKELKKSFMIKDETGKPMEARKVFGAGIKYLKDHLITKVKRTLPETREEDIRFVLTVPAIWNEGAKLFMREAAKVAGIIPNRLLIALEPEAASIYCKHIDLANFSGVGANFKPFAAGSRYVILDAGGGTIDITVHEVQSDGHLKELYNANGGAWGGAYVDKCFEDFLREVTGDDVIEQFKTEHVGEYLDIFKEFEVKKREIKDGMRDRMQIKLDSNIPRIYKSKRNIDLQKSIKEDPNYGVTGLADWMGDKMRVKKQVCFKFFERALKSIGDHLEELMKKPECNGADTILMVGGFSESPLLQEYVIKRFSKKRVIVPEGAGMSVLKGAVIFGHDPTAISERKCRYTYGCEMFQRFNKKIHDPKRKILSKEGVFYCKEVFSVHVKKNTVVKCGEYQVEKDYVPVQGVREPSTFQLYASENDNPKYINDSGCFHLGQISIVLPEGATEDEKKIKLKLKFGTTNLEATATAVKTGKSVTASFELSS